MSEERKITLKMSLEDITETAKALGYIVKLNAKVRLYRREEQADVVVSLPGTTYTLGFKKTADGLEMIHDNMINEEVNAFVVETYKRMVDKRLQRSRFKLKSQQQEKKAVVLRYCA